MIPRSVVRREYEYTVCKPYPYLIGQEVVSDETLSSRENSPKQSEKEVTQVQETKQKLQYYNTIIEV